MEFSIKEPPTGYSLYSWAIETGKHSTIELKYEGMWACIYIDYGSGPLRLLDKVGFNEYTGEEIELLCLMFGASLGCVHNRYEYPVRKMEI